MAGATYSEQPEGSCLGVLTRCFDRRRDKTRPSEIHPSAPTPNSLEPSNGGAPGTRDDTSPDPDDLWRRAYEDLDKETQKVIGGPPANPVTEKSDWAEALVEMVREKEKQYASETPKLKIDGREIIWRDHVKRVVAILTTIGDISITFAPAPSSVVWSAVKTLMQTHVSQCQDLAAMLGCADKTLILVRRGQVYEAVYLGGNPRNKATEGLQIALVDCYKTVLELLAHASTRLNQGQGKQLLQALIRPGQGEELVSALSKCEDQLAKAAQTCESITSKEHSTLLQNLNEPIRLVKDDVTTLLEHVEEDSMIKVLRYISSIPFGEHHDGKTEARTPGTCEWLLKHPKFVEWEASSCSSILWLQGNVGTGKSFLSSKVIDRYRHEYGANDQQKLQHDEGFAYFYCDRLDEVRRRPKTILGSYIRQLAEIPHHPSRIHKDVYNLHRHAEKEERHFSTDECKTLLCKLVNFYPRTTLIMDAMDECEREDRQHLLDILFSLAREGQYPVKIFIASRPETDIHAHPGFGNLVEIRTADNKGDIENYIDQRLRQPGQWVSVPQDVKEKVKSTITNQSNGMFRWAALQWEQIRKLETKPSIETRLGQLPQGLKDTYQEIYGMVELEDQLILQRTVKWVLCAKIPLGSGVLLPAIRLHGRRDRKEASEWHPEPIPQGFESTVKSICRHLVVKDSKLGIWAFAHSSVAEYFENHHRDWVDTADEDVAAVLLSNLTTGCSRWASTYEREYTEIPRIEPLFRRGDDDSGPPNLLPLYTIIYWVLHVRSTSLQSKGQKEVQRLLKRLLGSKGRPRGHTSLGYQAWSRVIRSRAIQYQAWRSGRWHARVPYYIDRKVSVHDGHEMHAADLQPAEEAIFGICTLGLHSFLQGWWDRDLEVSQINARGLDLLGLAAKNGHADLCSDLIDKGCDPNRRLGFRGQTALHLAIDGEHTETVRQLLNKGSNPNLVGQSSSLCRAVRVKSRDIIAILLEKQADPNIECQVCDFGCASEAATFYNSIGTASNSKPLLQYGARVNSACRCGRYGRPLAAAVCAGSLDCVELLVNHGAEVNAQCKQGDHGSALAVAAASAKAEALKFVKFLVDHGADVNAQLEHGGYGSAFAVAISIGNPECVQFLIDHGADVNAQLEHDDFGSALARVAYRWKPECLQLLVRCGAKVNTPIKYGNYGSALAAAAYSGALQCAEILVEHGAEVNAPLTHGAFGNALVAAAYASKFECVKFLIGHGAEVNACIKFGNFGSALIAAAHTDNLGCIGFLIRHGAEVNAYIKFGNFGSALIAAAYADKLESVRFLIRHGAEVNAYINSGVFGSALVAALFAREGGLEIIKYLIEEVGADTVVLSSGLEHTSREWQRNPQAWESPRVRRRVGYLVEKAMVERKTLQKIGCPVEL